jgi:hypothetical protein
MVAAAKEQTENNFPISYMQENDEGWPVQRRPCPPDAIACEFRGMLRFAPAIRTPVNSRARFDLPRPP